MYSLEILSVDQCEETSEDFIEEEKENLERQFYHGGRVCWLNFWLAEKKFVGEVIQRDAYREMSKLLHDILKRGADQVPVNNLNIYHHPGSGGSTVARQVLWNNRKDLRCAIVKPSYSANIVSEHVVQLREYEEKDPPQKCLPVLLLVEECDNEYLEDLRTELEAAVYTKKIAQGTPCFILLSCRRSHNPEKKCKESPLQNVAVTHKLSTQEKRQFAGKRKKLEEQYQPEFILTFVLMSEEFDPKYIKNFVEHLLQDIDHTTVVTRLIRYVALLNSYVKNSFISQSHCEVLMTLTIQMDRFRQHTFERSLSEQAKLIFIHLRDDKTHIQSIRVIHPLVAKEILQQLLGSQQKQSGIAMDLLHEDVLYENRFGKEEYTKFLRHLFMRRWRISKGDESDSLFSPLIEHVRKEESKDKAIELLKEAYLRFNKDAFFAQQLARLSYFQEKFKEAEQWAEIAAKKMPKNSYILDTKEDGESDKENKYEIIMSAVEFLKRSYWTKMKDIPQRKRRIYTHFFLGSGSGRDKIVHKSNVESLTKLSTLSEKRKKWLRGDVWKMPQIATLLKPVHGWTEDGTVFLQGPRKKFMIPALYSASLPYSNENVTFYLGFTFRGPVAYNITVMT
ncbi:hypothetical protein AAFF_G00340290 [Aldrovandia affinis]|uniref:Zmp:0000000735 n=1 Tax=Aldrovandia affinis TaxID=143900 RepID=A0AAD7SMK7_9TELE|nr:hypothetical protein AAFF_G00340290 [Aldrovandia affinis]